MSATLTQFAAVLNLLPEPTRVYDVQGRVVAENLAARSVAWPDDNGGDGETSVATIELDEGWYLRRINPPPHLPFPHGAVAGSPLVRPNMQGLLAGITHELRNPMAAILTAAALLQDDSGLSEESAMLLSVVRKEARRMNQIMTEFSLYVKPPQPHPEKFDLAKLTCDVLAQLQQEQVIPESVTVRDQMAEEMFVYADQSQITQALCRILENAAEAMARRTDAVLSLSGQIEAEANRVTLCVEDNGDGLDADDLKRAFLPFYSTKPQSTGLGLSTAQVVVQAAGGALWLENIQSNDPAQPIAGARVCFSLPQPKL